MTLSGMGWPKGTFQVVTPLTSKLIAMVPIEDKGGMLTEREPSAIFVGVIGLHSEISLTRKGGRVFRTFGFKDHPPCSSVKPRLPLRGRSPET